MSDDVKTEQCKATIYSGKWGLRSHQCSFKAKADGFCKVHHPDTKKAREEEFAARYREEAKARSRQWAREAAGRSALALLPSIPLIHTEACELGPRHPDRACTCWVAKAEAILDSLKEKP